MNNDHHRPECVHSNSDEAPLALRDVILDGKREWVIQHSVALGKRHTVLLDVCCILFRIEFDGYIYTICI